MRQALVVRARRLGTGVLHPGSGCPTRCLPRRGRKPSRRSATADSCAGRRADHLGAGTRHPSSCGLSCGCRPALGHGATPTGLGRPVPHRAQSRGHAATITHGPTGEQRHPVADDHVIRGTQDMRLVAHGLDRGVRRTRATLGTGRPVRPPLPHPVHPGRAGGMSEVVAPSREPPPQLCCWVSPAGGAEPLDAAA